MAAADQRTAAAPSAAAHLTNRNCRLDWLRPRPAAHPSGASRCAYGVGALGSGDALSEAKARSRQTATHSRTAGDPRGASRCAYGVGALGSDDVPAEAHPTRAALDQ